MDTNEMIFLACINCYYAYQNNTASGLARQAYLDLQNTIADYGLMDALNKYWKERMAND